MTGVGIIVDEHYTRIGTVHAGNGLSMDGHELIVTPRGQAWIIGTCRLRWPGVPSSVLDGVIQEIDLRTGLVMFEWHAIDHVPLTASEVAPLQHAAVYDPYHLNSLALGSAGTVVISMRNTSAVYAIDVRTGAVLWTLGGKRSAFKMTNGAETAFQHDATVQPDGTVALFNNGGTLPAGHAESRAVTLALDRSTMSARLVHAYAHTPPLFSPVEGSMQVLPGGDAFVGWGLSSYLTEFDPGGAVDFDARFVTPTGTYRAYRSVWRGEPLTRPRLATVPSRSGSTTAYISWNGATNVKGWRVLAGRERTHLAIVATAPATGFETAIHLDRRPTCIEAQALSRSGSVLAVAARC